jgi:ABC-type transport system substrate-binding protein
MIRRASRRTMGRLALATGQLQPWLASGYAYSDGYRSLTIYLGRDVHWNAEVKFTSADVVYTMDQIISAQPTPWRAVDIQVNVASANARGPCSVPPNFHYAKDDNARGKRKT